MRGLVARRADPGDARACRIVLTAEGRDVQRRLGRILAQRVTTAMTRALSPAQMEVLRDLGQVLIASSPAVSSRPRT